MESRRTAHKRRRMLFPPRWEQTWNIDALILSPAPEPQRKAMGKLLKENFSEAGVRLVREIEDRAKMTSQGNARIPRLIHNILPCVRITEPNRAANSMKSALLCTERLDCQPNKRPTTNSEKGSVALLRNSGEQECVCQDIEPPKSNSISRKDTKFLGAKRIVEFSKGALRHMKIRERKCPS